ncbi:MAG: hypothetical protein U0T77_03530 [Chitinophagales bacterium]
MCKLHVPFAIKRDFTIIIVCYQHTSMFILTKVISKLIHRFEKRDLLYPFHGDAHIKDRNYPVPQKHYPLPPLKYTFDNVAVIIGIVGVFS